MLEAIDGPWVDKAKAIMPLTIGVDILVPLNFPYFPLGIVE
jgi:hypothetical protein